MKFTTRSLRVTTFIHTVIVTLICFLIVQSVSAGQSRWKAIPGTTTGDTNWSSTANWTATPAQNSAIISNYVYNVGNHPAGYDVVINGGYSSDPYAMAWSINFAATNGFDKVYIPIGMTLYVNGGSGSDPNIAFGGGGLAVGCQSGGNDAGTSFRNTQIPNSTNYVQITGDRLEVTCDSGTGTRNIVVHQQSNLDDQHNAILDLSGLNNFIVTNNDYPNGGRLLVANGGNYANGVLYLAKTNQLWLGGDLQIGWQGSSTNTLPVGVYLGQTNLMITDFLDGAHGNGNNSYTIGYSGCTNGFLKFNPAFIGGATKPTAYLTGGSLADIYFTICSAGNNVPCYGIADFTGGQVTLKVTHLRLGLGYGAGGANNSALGVLNFDDGTVSTSDATVGEQQTSGAGKGVGIINIGTNGVLNVSGTLTLGKVDTGTLAAGTAGTINVNTNGILNVGSIVTGAGAGTLNLTNATLVLSNLIAGNTALTNIVLTALNTGGSTNVIIIGSFSTPPTSYPVTNKLVSYSGSIGGAGFNFGLVLPDSNPAYVSALVDNSANQEIDLVLTSGPQPVRALYWNGTDGSNPNNWDVGSSLNWTTNGGPATYFNQLDFATFDDTATGSTNINLTTTVTPATLTVSNNLLNYTFAGSGKISGNTGLNKQGTGALLLDEDNGNNDFSGGVLVGGGSVQIGNGDGRGSIGSGVVTNNATLIFKRGLDTTVANTISGSGLLIQSGGDVLTLSGGNTFTGNLILTNSSTLKVGGANALGRTNGAVIIASDSTLDENGNSGGTVGSKPVFASGTGIGGSGTIVNNTGYADPLNVTLTGNTTFGGSARFDLTGRLSTGGNTYNVTIVGNAYHEWSNLSVDTNLANITVQGAATLGDKGTTAMGNPSGILEIATGATLQFWNNGGANVMLNKHLQVDDSSTVQNGFSANTISGPVTLSSGYCSFVISAGTLTMNGALDGSGILYENTGTGTLVINGNGSSFTGGALVYAGNLVLNNNFGSGSVTMEPGTILAGNGTAGGLVDIYGALLPGNTGTAGTFTANGGLILEGGGIVTNDLSATIGGSNDLIAVTGDLTVNGNEIVLNLLNGTLQNGIYPLITYTGTYDNSGGDPYVHTVSPSSYTLTFTNITSSTPKKLAVIVGGNPSLLAWNNGSGNNEWDVAGAFNWSNLVSHASEQFVNADTIIFDDSITNAVTPGTNIDIASGQIVIPAVITNNSTVDYTISGAGKISGGASLVKTGSGTLTLSNANDFTGDIYVSGGILRGWTAGNFGATNGTITVTNGATLDRGWDAVKAIVVSGAGVGGNGALVNNSSGSAIYDGAGGLTRSLTLAGDTTFGGNTRWDLGGSTGATINCLGSSNYNLTINEASGTYMEWDNLTIDINLGNIDIYTTGGGSLGVKGCGASLGNPTNTITVHPNSELTFWGETSGNSGYAKNIHVMTGGIVDFRPQHADVYYNAALILDDGANVNFFNGSGSIGTAMLQPMQLNGVAHLQIGDSTVTFSNVISGTGGFYWDNYNNTLVFTATNTYQGATDIRSGRTLALKDNGSISGSTNIVLASGATLNVSARNNQTFTLATGQTLQGIGVVAGNLAVGSSATVSPAGAGATGILTVTNNVTLSGIASMDLNQSLSTNDVLRAANLTYGGTLSLNNIAGTLAANDQFKLFNAGTYIGVFSSITPANPNNDPGLAWDTNSLAVNGTLKIVSAIVPRPTITGISLNGMTLTIAATNGANGGQFILLQSTNVALPLNQWTPVLTNNFDGSGNLNLSTNIINPGDAQEFYILQSQ